MVCGCNHCGTRCTLLFCSRRDAPPEEHVHPIIKKYLDLFHRLICLDDIDVSELVVWTTGYLAEMVGVYDRESRHMQDRMEGTIRTGVLGEMSGKGAVSAWASLADESSESEGCIVSSVVLAVCVCVAL